MKMKLVSQFFHIDQKSLYDIYVQFLDVRQLSYAPLLTTLAAAAAGVPSAASITASRCGLSLATNWDFGPKEDKFLLLSSLFNSLTVKK